MAWPRPDTFLHRPRPHSVEGSRVVAVAPWGGARIAPPLRHSFLLWAVRYAVGWASCGRGFWGPASPGLRLRPQDSVSCGEIGLVGGAWTSPAPSSLFSPPPRRVRLAGGPGAGLRTRPGPPRPRPSCSRPPPPGSLRTAVPHNGEGGMGSGHRLRPAARPDCRGPRWRRRRQQVSPVPARKRIRNCQALAAEMMKRWPFSGRVSA